MDYPPKHLVEDPKSVVSRLANVVGYLETALAEAEGMPQVGGPEATIIEQVEAAIIEVQGVLEALDPEKTS